MLFIHFANVYLSDLTEEDPCSLWVPCLAAPFNCQAVAQLLNYVHISFPLRYLINFLLDASLGMLFIYAGVRTVSAVVEWRQWDSLRFGEYGENHLSGLKCPREGWSAFKTCNICEWSLLNVWIGKHNFYTVIVTFLLCIFVGEPVKCTAWLGQCVLYILIMMFEKVAIMLVLLIPEWKKVRTNFTRLQFVYQCSNFGPGILFIIHVSVLVSGPLKVCVCMCVTAGPPQPHTESRPGAGHRHAHRSILR